MELVDKVILLEDDKKNIISLYQPIIGPIAVSLYFTLLNDLSILDYISNDYTHYHLMVTMSSSLDTIKKARESLEAVGLLKTYYKEDTVNNYIYELYSPVSAHEFFSHPIFNIVLYNTKYQAKTLRQDNTYLFFDNSHFEFLLIEGGDINRFCHLMRLNLLSQSQKDGIADCINKNNGILHKEKILYKFYIYYVLKFKLTYLSNPNLV